MHHLMFWEDKMNLIVYLCAFLKNVIYGTSVFFTGKLTASVDVVDVLALRFLMSFVVLFILKSTKIINVNVGVKDFFVKNERSIYIKSLLLTAIFEPILYMLFETLGISMTTGITAGMILSLNPVSSCIFEEIILKEKTTFWQKIFLGLGIVGVMYIAVNTNTSTGKDSVAGIIFLIIAVVSGSLFLVFSRKSSKAFSSMEITYIYSLLGMIAFNFINIIRHIYMGNIADYFLPYFNFDNMVGFVFLAVISAIAAVGMNNFALARMQVSTMSAFGGVSTLTTIIVGIIFGGESLKMFHVIGLTFIVARMVGVSAIAIKKDNKRLNLRK